MRYKKGFKFKPTFQSEIEYFEFDHLDESTNLVHTVVHHKLGMSFADNIEKIYYDTAFENGDYIAIK